MPMVRDRNWGGLPYTTKRNGRYDDLSDPTGCGGYGPVIIELASGESRTVDYSGMDGRLMF